MKQVKLAEVKRAFARWRAGKGRPGQPVPERLWARAVEAARVHGPTKTAKALRLNHSTLKRRIGEAAASARSPEKPEFFELPLGPLRPPESTLEFEDVTGARLRLVLQGARPEEVAAAACQIWGARP